jgi:hypothetical protein
VFVFVRLRVQVTSKPTLAVCGTLAAAMAVFSAMGICTYCGLQFNTIVNVMPFLIVCK